MKGAEKTVDKLNNVLASTGTEVTPSSIHPDKKSNLNSDNWILDGKKIDDLND